jgi:hypothetical protein
VVSAEIVSFSPSIRTTAFVEEPVALELTLINTGSLPRKYYLRATLNDIKGNSIFEPLSYELDDDLNPGSTTTIRWSTAFADVGDIYVKFEVWTKSPVTSAILLTTARANGNVFITAQERVKFNIDDAVSTIVDVDVYKSPGTDSPEIDHPRYFGKTFNGTNGNIRNGPVSATGAEWWQVEFIIRGYTGWVREEFIEKN